MANEENKATEVSEQSEVVDVPNVLKNDLAKPHTNETHTKESVKQGENDEKPEKDVERVEGELDEDSKTSDNDSNDTPKELEKEEVDSAENGESSDTSEDAVCIKRKSTGNDLTGEETTENGSPPKKAKLDNSSNGISKEATKESNGVSVAVDNGTQSVA